MTRKIAALLLVLASVALLAFVTGCKKSAPGAAKVDLQAQLDALKNPDKDTRMNGYVALATLKEGAGPAVPQITEGLKDPDPDIRRLAAYALMEIGPAAKSALPQLQSMMQDPDRTVLTQVINTIRTVDPNQMKDLDLQKVINQ